MNIDPSHLAAMPTLRLELGSPLLMTALNWLKEEGLVLDEVGGGLLFALRFHRFTMFSTGKIWKELRTVL